MRTFEQYINESRQNYIFGGTDNRNTQDAKTGTPFVDLKKGDKFYWFVYDDQGYNTYKKIELCDVETNPRIENNYFRFMSNYGSFVIPLKYAKEPSFKCKDGNLTRLTYYGATTCTGIIDVLNYDNITADNFDEIEQASLKEARQNYIFGGTDNRNTNVMYSKKICELKQGDKLYWCNLDNNGRIKSTDNVDICKFVSIENLESKNYKLNFSYLLDGRYLFGNAVVDKRNLDSTVNEHYNGHMSYTIVGTNLDDLLDTLKDYVKVDSDVEAARKFFEEKEEELGKANESRQNYIFGGTDNRNTNVSLKTIGELKDGDTFYWFSRAVRKAWKLTLSKIYKSDDELQVFFYYYNQHRRKPKYCMMPVDRDIYNLTSYIDEDEYFAVAIDETEFLTMMRKYKIYKEDIIDETVK